MNQKERITLLQKKRKPTPQQLRKAARERFLRARKVEGTYQKQLVRVARNVGNVVKTFAPDGVVTDMAALMRVLQDYSKALLPWAKSVSEKMVAEIGVRDARAWKQLSEAMGQQLRFDLTKAPMGHTLQASLSESVNLITSLPLDAAKRVHKLTTEALVTGVRAREIAEAIQKSGKVTSNRAKMIARTEVARTASLLTETRAKYIGSTSYIWRTSMDADVREEHKKLEGKVIDWDDPPVAGSEGERAHAGQIYNCRCWPEPILPDVIR